MVNYKNWEDLMEGQKLRIAEEAKQLRKGFISDWFWGAY